MASRAFGSRNSLMQQFGLMQQLMTSGSSARPQHMF
jgi:hypothetical protein